MDPDKRRMRRLKKSIKRAGNKKRRQDLKRTLTDDPASAHEVRFQFGRDSSTGLNGLDTDATRRRDGE